MHLLRYSKARLVMSRPVQRPHGARSRPKATRAQTGGRRANEDKLNGGRTRAKPAGHFLNHVRKNKVPLTIFLVNGVKLQGVVTWFDNFCVLLRRDGHSQLVYKHAISTIMPGQPVQLFEPEDEGCRRSAVTGATFGGRA